MQNCLKSTKIIYRRHQNALRIVSSKHLLAASDKNFEIEAYDFEIALKLRSLRWYYYLKKFFSRSILEILISSPVTLNEAGDFILILSRKFVLDIEAFCQRTNKLIVKENVVCTEDYLDGLSLLPLTSYSELTTQQKQPFSWLIRKCYDQLDFCSMK